VRIETGRTSDSGAYGVIGHSCGDTAYGAPGQLTDQVAAQARNAKAARRKADPEVLRWGGIFCTGPVEFATR